MKTYKSFLASKINEYIIHRKSIGYLEKSLCRYLEIFDLYTNEHAFCSKDLKPIFFLNFRQSLTSYAPKTINSIFSTLNGFIHFLIRKSYLLESPLTYLSSVPERAYIPFVFSKSEVDSLLIAIQQDIRKDSQSFLRDFTIYVVIMLLARCGLRISEPLKLQRTSYRDDDGTLYIKNTKFHKDRIIPVPAVVMPEIENYLSAKDSITDSFENPYLLPGYNKNRLLPEQIYPVFHKGVKAIGIHSPAQIIGNTKFGSPTCHSLRHSFAINTLKRIRENGRSPQDALPVLAAYMGHKKYQYTAVYLKALDAEHRQGLFDITIKHRNDI